MIPQSHSTTYLWGFTIVFSFLQSVCTYKQQGDHKALLSASLSPLPHRPAAADQLRGNTRIGGVFFVLVRMFHELIRETSGLILRILFGIIGGSTVLRAETS
jgi:hypothetical protein